MRILFFVALVTFFCSFSGIFAQNKKVLDSLNSVYQTAKHDTTKIMALTSIAFEYKSSKPDTCIVIADKALQMSEKIGFEKGKAWALNATGAGNLIKAKYADALVYYQNALSLFGKVQDKKGISTSLNNVGLIYDIQGNYFLALDYNQKSLKIRESIGDKQGIAMSLSNIGNIYNKQGNYPQALVYYKHSLEIQEQISDKQGISGSLNNIGITYFNQGNYPQALTYHQRSLEIREQIGNKQGVSHSLNNIGDVHNKENNYSLALKYYQNSLQIKEETGDRWGSTYSLNGLAQVIQKQKDYDNSIEYAIRSLNIAQEIKAPTEIKNASETLYNSYKLKGNYVKALEYHELYKTTNDSLFNVDKSKAIANLEAKVEIEKQKVEIEKQKVEIEKQKEAKEFQQYINYLILAGLLLVLVFAYFVFKFGQKQKKAKEEIEKQKEEIDQQNNFLAIQAEELNKLNHFKDQLFSIIAHDLRSPMAVLQGTINILDPDILNKSELDMIKNQLTNQFEVTDKILQDLLQWTKDQMKGETIEAKQLNVNEIVNEKISLFTAIAQSKDINLLSELMPDTPIFADGNHVNIILQNLLSNGLKFTYSGGTITIKSQKIDKMVQISVADTGKGMNEEQQSKLFTNQYFTTKGTTGEKGNGLGLHLVKDLVEKNGGKIWVTSEEGKGSEFCFLLPTNK
jgi:two-component system sensor histidine kinase/response regulator